MKKVIFWISGIFLVFLYNTAAFAVDCNATRPPLDESASSFLVNYAENCDGDIKAEVAKWRNADSSPNFPVILQRWEKLRNDTARLVNDWPDSETKSTAVAIKNRIEKTSETLSAEIAQKNLVSLTYKQDTWIMSDLVLRRYPIPPSESLAPENFAQKIDLDCAAKSSDLCAAAFTKSRSLVLFWRTAFYLGQPFTDEATNQLLSQVEKKEKSWNKFLYDSKPMLPFDFFLTDLIERQWSKSDQYPTGFREPPRRQWFLFHPSAGMEYVSGATDGQQLKPILQLEVVGVNWWNEDDRPFKGPVVKYLSGISLLVTYADRSGVKDTGVGALISFDNVYSVGITQYGSKTGFSISLDLANLYREKYKEKYDFWKNKLSKD